MTEVWQQNIRTYRDIIYQNLGPRVVNIVSGSPADQAFWQERLENTRQDVFRSDGQTMIISSLEKTRKGNFLGSVNAWMGIQKALADQTKPPLILMNMVFGQGKRLSPFTQALTNRKPAFPTPMRAARGDVYLSTADAASMSATLWLNHLESHGFKGIIVKWGDEAVIPGKIWEAEKNDYQDVDGIRFVWQTEPTEDLAREKEWVEFDAETSQMTYQYTRQGLDSLRQRLAESGRCCMVGVNLGSLGISYRLMQVVEEVFRQDVADESKWVDWDPYTWIALSCTDETGWQAEAEREDRMGKHGLREVEKRVPDFYQKIQQVRELFQKRHGRFPVVNVLDFGQPFWMDWGLQLSLRRSLEAMITDSDIGKTSRELFHLQHERDVNGNILLRSTIPQGADIRDSLLVDTIITDPESAIHGGVVVAGRHRTLKMPEGGSALFCAVDEMKFNGPHGIAYKLTGDQYSLKEGDRLTCLYLTDGMLEMGTNESLVSYDGDNYSLPVMGNPISFEEATRRMSMENNRLVEKRWLERWSAWLTK
ncbi:MAG: hypothetical protein WAV05_19120 [Anaerolineales bacterium]